MTDLLTSLREASYPTPDGGKVLYSSGGDIARQLEDLYAVVPELGPSGSSNRENDVLRQALTDLRAGKADLSDAQWGEVQRLLEKYKTQLAALAASRDRQGQDYRVPAEGAGRVVAPGAAA